MNRSIEINVRFSESEMKVLLERTGFVVKEVETWRNEKEYHNQVVTIPSKIMIAYPKPQPPDDQLLGRDRDTLEREIGLERVFTMVFKINLIEKLFPKGMTS